jgi:hypothetical protein
MKKPISNKENKERKYWNNSSSRVSTSAFAFSLYDLEVLKGQEVQMGLTNDSPIYCKPYKYSEMERKMIEARMKEQIYGDYCKILKHTKLDRYGMTIRKEIFGTIGHAKFFSTLDLQLQYHQFGIREEKKAF